MGTALFVGRFQPFHKGHLLAVKGILKTNERVVILIGSAHEHDTSENPFTVEERIEMIRLSLQSEGIRNFEITSLKDFNDDELWTTAIMKAIDFDAVYSCNPWTLRCFRKVKKVVRRHRLYHPRKYSGTEIRKRIRHGKDWKELVPPAVYDFIRSTSGEERIKKLL
jgi:nicotinamide-nucleotide adenylyltransferase